jgi:hypothetical protein
MSWESNKLILSGLCRRVTINYLCTYDLYSPVQNVLDACISITRGSGRGLGPGIREFFGPCEVASSPMVTLTGCILGRSRAHTVRGGGAGE